MTDDAPHDHPPPGLLPAGLIDLLPPEAEREAALVETLMAAFGAHGYERVKPPLLEFEDSLLAGSGAAVAEQTFRLMDPVSQRMMGLRADTTPQVARIAATRLGLQARPLRLCYAGQVLRVRGTQIAPERQLPQVGVELIGSDAAAADAEVAVAAAEALARAGVAGATLDISLPTMAGTLLEAAGLTVPALEARGVRRKPAQDMVAALRLGIDRKDPVAVLTVAERAAPLAVDLADLLPRLLRAAGPAEAALAALAAMDLPTAARRIADNAAEVVAAIRARDPDLRMTLDPMEFRGFPYHTGVAFTVFGPGATGELGRGGRYLSLNEEPATGMSLYPDAVQRAAPPPAAPRRLFAPLGTAEATLAALRAQGYATVRALSAADAPRALRCSHILRDGSPVPVTQEEG
ncbi:ATP phosphoribosyltransferase regulatory subunit [Paracraurococcus ruber]|uniref:ATP phosphoribosyltransferase regulatory subunit n=1 Tax=Paracraurococcus ruber TaxID=77675 RepID=A0ABS1CT62_9PROT|nr:ATP phosphoribosyltransferase regulatory subunit [Paracraurococcus ruber]MBK1657553.1 ATP phosphoribosyltransferase regulatory subunit [Paracraurococcus ruber]TDG34106.1 ATP phosphoribosyltransferase regulatory subunit [Paracraurococcus ruber]